ncbi:MAG: ABC transporter ATP-binding protein [Gemmatimonadaceae bacterium]|jgi:ABC-2 type transport system ATP-binding protein|nr:ABC transporter ATP-binding protein [Gemmatimonadaceae bacterium]
MLEAAALSKSFGDHVALHPLTLRVAPGEILCLLGANGAGKTTTINLFLDFIPRSGGRALVDGLDVAAEPLETKRRLAYIPEQVQLYRTLTGVENLDYFQRLSGRPPLDRAALLALCDRVGLPAGAADRRVSTYSKGMRQKVGIAIAIAKEARALLLDEPTSGLDPQASNEFSALLAVLRDDGVAILMATHDLFRARETGTHIAIMKHGRMVDRFAAADIGHADLERLYLDHMRN